MGLKDLMRDNFDIEEKEKAQSPEEDSGKKGKKEAPVFPEDDVQNLIPIKQIYKGMIITTDDRYIKIIEVLPINFSLRSYEEQANIIHSFAGWLRIAPIKLQFKVITRRADSIKIINNVRAQTEGETQEKCRKLARNYIEFIRELSGNEALSRRFFLIFEYERANTQRKRTIDDIAAEVADTARKIRSGLMSCGNEVVIPENEDYFQAEALYLFYNKKSSTIEQLADRVVRVSSDVMKYYGLTEGVDDYPDIPICDYVAPRGVDFTQPDYFICDGMYQVILMVKKDGYPNTVYAGWMSTLIETGAGVDVDIILHRESKTFIRDKVALNLKLNRIKASGRSDVDTDFEEIAGAISSAQYIKSCLASGEDFYNMYVFITVSADTKDELDKRVEGVFDYLYANDIEAKAVKYRLEDAFQVVAPLLINKPELMSHAARNIMTGGAASTYPFTSCELCDENGVVLGVNRRYQSLVNLDVFNTKKYKNANISIVGSSGSGKTYTELTMALRMRIQGIQTFIIAPDKAHEFRRACGHIDGSFIRISPSSKSCIMEIRPVQNPVSEFLDDSNDGEDDSWLFQKANQLRTFFKLLIPDLTNEEEQLVDEAIIKTYNMFKITHENGSIYNPDHSIKPMPIIGDLFEVIRRNPDLKRVGNILSRFVTGSAQSFNQQTNVDLQNKFIVFDLSDLSDSLKAVGMFIVMDFLWTKIKENRTERKALFIDEGWQLIGASTDSKAADFVYRIFKIIRGYGGSAVFATQDISDLFAFQDGKYGKAIISNSKIKIVLGLEPQEAKVVRDVLQLTKNEVRSITNFQRGEGLICVNNNKLPVLIRASEMEHTLITTDPAQLRELLNKAQAEKKELAAQYQRAEFHNALQKSQMFDELQAEYVSSGETPVRETFMDSELDPPIREKEPAEAPAYQDKYAAMTETERERHYEQEALMSMQAMEQMEESDFVRDMDGNIVRDSEDDAAIVPVQEEKEIYHEDESVLLSDAKEEGKKAPPVEEEDTDLKQAPPVDRTTQRKYFLSNFYSEGGDF